jgi:plasmid replication initiation protein
MEQLQEVYGAITRSVWNTLTFPYTSIILMLCLLEEGIFMEKNTIEPMKFNVVKSNALNEMRNANFSLVEYRLFCVYLSKLDAKKKNPSFDDCKVTFPLREYARIMDLEQPRHDVLRNQAKSIVEKSLEVQLPHGGFSRRSVFISFDLSPDDNGEWQVSLTCHPELMPNLFANRQRFLMYKLFNAISLTSYNQIRTYELLKQYQNTHDHSRTITLKDYREYLSLEDKYPTWRSLNQDVLKVCQKAINEKTDICFEYIPIKKRNKVTAVRFLIAENPNFKDQLRLNQFVDQHEDTSAYNDAEEVHETQQDNAFGSIDEKGRSEAYVNLLEMWQVTLEPYSLTLDEVDLLAQKARDALERYSRSDLRDPHHEIEMYFKRLRLTAARSNANPTSPYAYLAAVIDAEPSKFC